MPTTRLANLAVAVVVIGLLWLGLVLNFDFGRLRPTLERRLSAQFGQTVRIGALARLDRGFHPTARINGLRIAQPDWAGKGDMVRVRSATIGLRLAPLLIGRVVPDYIDVDGLRLALVRRDGAHANWRGLGSSRARGGRSPRITIRDALITLDDRKHDHVLAARVVADDTHFRLAGRGRLADRPSTIDLSGPSLAKTGAWPFRLDYRSPIANATLAGRADHAIDLGHFSAHMVAWGDNLKSLDRLIDAGVPDTQPFRLSGEVAHTSPVWTLSGIKGRVGRSDVALAMTVRKRDGRTLIDGSLRSNAFDFDDLASDAQHAAAAAKDAALGPRIAPDTPIHLEHMRRTDGTLRVDLRRLLFDRPSSLRSMSGTLTLDHGVLTASPFAMGLATGRATGSVRVRHASGEPLLTADLTLPDSRLEAVIPQAFVTGALAGRLRLRGYGRTIREAVGRSTGTIALVARHGTITRRGALYLGADIGRALFENEEAKTGMPCLVARFEARSGTARPAPLLLDTDVAQITATGTVDLSTERVLLTLTGHPKLAGAVGLDAPVQIGGVLKAPKLVPQSAPKTVGTALTLIGKAIAGRKPAPVADANCAALAARALR